jgi:acetylornithine deacetylase/succinyl-diaminopimelate desuccinylase-like protein
VRPFRSVFVFAGVLAAAGVAAAQTHPFDAGKVKAYVAAHHQAIVQEFLGLVAIPDLHNDLPDIHRNAEYLKQMLDRRGMNGEIWETPSTPLVFGEKLVPGAKRTVLFYIHYDGQPVDAVNWKQADPFKPVLRDGSIEEGGKEIADIGALTTFPANWRIYGRAAADDKGPVEAFCAAMDAIGGDSASNIKVILHGEEEGGGPALEYVVKKYPEKLHSDVLIILDGPQHPSGLQTVYYGARGGAGLQLTVYTAKTGMHSGNYGNWMPDANVRLAQLLSSMVDESGKVVIDGFYSDVLPFPPDAVKMMNAVPDTSAEMQKEFGVGSLDGAASSLQEALNLPSFSVHMMKGGELGGVIPASATADIAMRLVKENSPQVMIDRVIAHIRKQGYYIVDKDLDVATLAAHARIAKVTYRQPIGPSGAWRTDPDSPQVAFVAQAMRSAWGEKMVRIRQFGGGVPAGPFIEAYHVPTLGVALANFDDNQHTDNENLRLGNLWDGIVTLAAIMQQQ